MTPTIRLLFFSTLQDLTQLTETAWPIPTSGASLRRLRDEWEARWPALVAWRDRILIAVDLEFATLDQTITPGQEVALMPPVQGG
jgi:MoaE-MoaD fusion protein